MIRAPLHVAAVLALLVGPGLLPTLALIRRGPLVLAVAPLLTALGCTVAATLSVGARISYPLCLAGVFVAGGAVSLLRIRGRRPTEPTAPAVTWTQLLCLGAVPVLPLLAVHRPPVDWDARAVWLLHADWFRVGGARAASALGNPLFAITHPDYPPLAPATMAGTWTVLGRDYELGQLALALLIASVTLVAGLALCMVMKGLPRPATTVAAGVMMLGMYGMAGATATDGYADMLWSVGFAAAALCLLLGPLDGDAAIVGGIGLAVAMATKNEGMVAGMGLILVTVVVRGWRRPLALAAPAVLLSAAWVVIRTALGAKTDATAPGRLSDLLHLRPAALDRVGPTAAALWTTCGWEVLVAAILTATGVAVARRRRRRLLVTGWAPLWITAVMSQATIAGAYVLSPYDVRWHLATSVDRTTLAPRMLLLAEVAIWSLLLWSQRRVDENRAGPAPRHPAAIDREEHVREPVLPSR